MPSPKIEAARMPAGPKVREWARKHSFDEWMVARFAHLVPRPGRLLEGLSTMPPRYIRVNPLRAEIHEVETRLDARGFTVAQTAFDPQILRIREAPISPGATQEHLLGMTTPQDLASASAPIALDAGSAETIVDMAAAPGIKTLHLAGDMGSEGRLVAVEPNPDRMRALRFNLERCGVTNTALLPTQGQELPGEEWADKVLLDAPCTGEGTLPRDRKRRRGRIEEITDRAALQSELVDAADRILRPGGIMVYATCTLAPEENEAQVQRLLDRGYAMEDLPFDHCGDRPLLDGITEWPGLRLSDDITKAKRFLPGIHPTLGFFVARLRKEEGS